MTSRSDREYTLEVLNSLHAAEKRSLLPRLAELNAFVEWSNAHDMDQVRRMIAESARHDAWLMEAADRCDGTLFPAPPDASTASLHYADLRCLMPRVIGSVQKLVQTYGRAVKESGPLLPQAAEAVARIHNRHQIHLEQLRAIQARLAAGPA